MEEFIKNNIVRMFSLSNLSQTEFANKSNLSRQTINKLLSFKNEYNPNLSTLVAVSNALEVNLSTLLSQTMPSEVSDIFVLRELEDYQNLFNQNLKRYLRGWRQYSLSTPESIQESTISNLVNKKNKDTQLATIECIANEMKVPISKLFQRGEY